MIALFLLVDFFSSNKRLIYYKPCMELEPHLIKKQSAKLDHSINMENDHSSSDDDPYSFTSTSTSLIGLAIVFVMLGVPLLALITDRPDTKKFLIPTSTHQNGPESYSSFPIAWISKSSS